jgi:hypothetical protein
MHPRRGVNQVIGAILFLGFCLWFGYNFPKVTLAGFALGVAYLWVLMQ